MFPLGMIKHVMKTVCNMEGLEASVEPLSPIGHWADNGSILDQTVEDLKEIGYQTQSVV